MERAPTFEFHHGNSASMRQLADGAADLVVTSPPYYPVDVEDDLRRPIREQERIDDVDRKVTALALSLQPVFFEVARVLRGSGKLVVQTRDLRYGGYLIGPADTHRRLAEAAGFRLMTEISWQSSPASIQRDQARRAFWRSGEFVTDEVEKFLVFARGPILLSRRGPGLDAPAEFADPIWKLPAQGARSSHQHESPLSVLRRLIEVYSRPGDLVVDPFCGHGTTILAAVELGRSGVGWDIDRSCVDQAWARLARIRTAVGRDA